MKSGKIARTEKTEKKNENKNECPVQSSENIVKTLLCWKIENQSKTKI